MKTNRILLRAVFALVGLMGLFIARPAIVAAQTPAPAPPPRREGSAEFAFVGTSGNSSTETLGLSGEYIERPDPWELSVKAAYIRNESESVLSAESFAFTAKASRALTPRTSAFARYGYLHDRFSGIESRNGIEAGIAYTLIDAAPHLLIVDAGLGYAHETRVVPPNLSTATLPTGAVYKLKFSETAELDEEARFVFSLSDSGDWRFANVVSVAAKLTTLLSLKLSNTVRFVNQPTSGFEQTDTITAIALVAKF